jgi:hypothetical protein
MKRRVRKRFPRKPSSVNNVTDVWECDVEFQTFSKFNNNYRYMLTVIDDAFSKFLHISPIKAKTGMVVASVIRLIFKDPRYSKTLCTRPT